MTPTTVARPVEGEYFPAFGKYIALAPEGDLAGFLEGQLAGVERLLAGLSDEQALALHAPYTWSIKQVVGHVIDCERVFGYRLLRIARGDETPLPSFDENLFMQTADFNRWPLHDLVSEFASLRRSHVQMIRHFPAEAWTRRGTVSNHPMTARAMAYALAGHAEHHLAIARKRVAR